MSELQRIHELAAPSECLLVVDAITGLTAAAAVALPAQSRARLCSARGAAPRRCALRIHRSAPYTAALPFLPRQASRRWTSRRRSTLACGARGLC